MTDTPASTAPHSPALVRILRFAFAVLGFVALAWIPLRNLDTPSFSVANYFSYFTILSNVLALVVLLVGAVSDPQSERWQLFRGATTLYMVITGIIYAVLLADVDVQLTDKWINDTLHRYIPLVILLDWLISPPRMRISDGRSVTWLWFPLAYGIYTLVRGPFADFYPYPFIDPRSNGYLQMGIGLVVLLLAFVLMALAVNAAGRLAGRWRYGDGKEVETHFGGVEREVEE